MSMYLRVFVFVILGTGLSGISASDDSVIYFEQAVASGYAEVRPSESLSIDLSGYSLPEHATLILLQVYSNYYYLPLVPGKTIYRFSSDSVQSAKGSEKFSGLRSHDPTFLMIGREVSPGSMDVGALISDESVTVRVGM